MSKVLVVMDVLEEHKEILNHVSPDLDITYMHWSKLTASDLQDAEVIVGNLDPKLLVHCKNLKLLQLNNAGTEGFVTNGVLPDGALLANATGAYGVAMSEFMMGMLLSIMKKLDLYQSNQKNRIWKDEGGVPSIYGTTTLVVGFGDIGQEFGRRMHAFGSKVIGIRKHVGEKPDFAEAVYTMEAFSDCLKQADIVATCLPGYEETFKIFDKEAFENMKDGAYFINVGRGTAVDTDCLCEAIESGKLAGVALDVTDPEPLPSEHKLWELPNVVITPHVSGGYHVKESHDRIIEIAARNLKHFANGEEFENLVDMKTGYTRTNRK
ncbi:MAG: D-2-hydroxyacid dehydrogenase [Eubacteriales bacterium]|nr:D-2-hydroxyacid dehydrogenase [Eubacteriales bacterium]